jgi:hypothetical protein
MTLHVHSLMEELACVLPADDRTRVELRGPLLEEEEEAPAVAVPKSKPPTKRKRPPTLPAGARRPRKNRGVLLATLRADQPMTSTELRLRLARKGIDRPLSQVHCMLERLAKAGVVKRTEMPREPGMGNTRILWEAL